MRDEQLRKAAAAAVAAYFSGAERATVDAAMHALNEELTRKPVWPPAVGTQVFYHGNLCTVRYHGRNGTVRIDDGAPENPTFQTNGARFSCWVTEEEVTRA